MPLSIEKLEHLLSLKGFVPRRYYVMHKLCVYIEIFSVVDSDIFLLYIPSNYKFVIKKRGPNIHKINYLDSDNDDDNTADHYAGEPNEHLVENTYKEIDVGISPNIKGNNIGSYLEENYKRVIKLKDVSENDSKEIKDIIRQLKRLRFCVQNVKYKIAIVYKNFLCAIKRDNSVECYVINKYPSKNCNKLYITTDLEVFYKKMESLMLNIKTIREGLYHILDKNHFTHTNTLQKLLEEKSEIISFSERALNKKLEYEEYLKEATKMLERIKRTEKSNLSKIYEHNEKYKDPNMSRGIHNDIERTKGVSILEKELNDIVKIKEDIVNTLFELKTKRDNTMLTVDKIMFDNNVMLECVIRNFQRLGEICQ